MSLKDPTASFGWRQAEYTGWPLENFNLTLFYHIKLIFFRFLVQCVHCVQTGKIIKGRLMILSHSSHDVVRGLNTAGSDVAFAPNMHV